MLIAILLGSLIAALFGGDEMPPLADLVREQVTDEGRSGRAAGVAEDLEGALRDFEEARLTALDRLFEIDARHDATTADYEAIRIDFESRQEQAETSILDLRFRLKDEMTRDEWKALFDDLAERRE